MARVLAALVAALAAVSVAGMVQQLDMRDEVAKPLKDVGTLAAAKLLADRTESLQEVKLTDLGITTGEKKQLVKMGQTEEVKAKVAAGEIAAKIASEKEVKAHGEQGPPTTQVGAKKSGGLPTATAIREDAARAEAKTESKEHIEEKGLKKDYAAIQAQKAKAGRVLKKEMTAAVKMEKKGRKKVVVSNESAAEGAALKKELAAIRKPEQLMIQKMKEVSEKNISKQKAQAEALIVEKAKQHAATVAAIRAEEKAIMGAHKDAKPVTTKAEKAKAEIAAMMLKDGTNVKINRILPGQ